MSSTVSDSHRGWQSTRTQPVPWASGAGALATTLGVFATAFLSMTATHVLRLSGPLAEPIAPIAIHLPRPNPEAPPARRIRRQTSVPTAVAAPTAGAPASDIAPTGAAVEAPPRDTSAKTGSAVPLKVESQFSHIEPLRVDSASPLAGASVLRGAPAMTAAGVTVRASPMSAAARDSLAARAAAALFADFNRPMTADERETLRQNREPGVPAMGRAARAPGDPHSVPLMNGGYSVGYGLVSVPVGKKVNRRLNDSLDAEYQAHLKRLQEIIKLRRDSVRADSLRRDSIANRSRRPE